jgi:hypothetical protein
MFTASLIQRSTGATEMFAPCSRAALERLSETDRIIILEEQLRQEVTGFPTSSGQRAALPSGRGQ